MPLFKANGNRKPSPLVTFATDVAMGSAYLRKTEMGRVVNAVLGGSEVNNPGADKSGYLKSWKEAINAINGLCDDAKKKLVAAHKGSSYRGKRYYCYLTTAKLPKHTGSGCLFTVSLYVIPGEAISGHCDNYQSEVIIKNDYLWSEWDLNPSKSRLAISITDGAEINLAEDISLLGNGKGSGAVCSAMLLGDEVWVKAGRLSDIKTFSQHHMEVNKSSTLQVCHEKAKGAIPIQFSLTEYVWVLGLNLGVGESADIVLSCLDSIKNESLVRGFRRSSGATGDSMKVRVHCQSRPTFNGEFTAGHPQYKGALMYLAERG
jgi:hypothetical protein